MKKIAIVSLIFVATGVSAFSDTPNFRVVNVYHLSDKDLQETMQGHHPEMAVEFPEQTTLPIHFFLKGDLVNLVENEGKWGAIEVKQTFYVRCVGEELILSTNLTDWKPFLEFITGNASVALSIHDGQPSLIVGAETNRRS